MHWDPPERKATDTVDEPQLPSNVLEIDVYEGESVRMTSLLKRVHAITSEAPA